MKFVLIFGPQAVGKMTVGHELEKITELKLFHNHMTIELVRPFFSYGTEEGRRLVQLFRHEIFEAVSQSDLYGLIFTYLWNLDRKEEWEYVDKVCRIFESKGGTVYFVELEAGLHERLKRNKTPHRLEHKPSKRDLEWSERDLLKSAQHKRLNSMAGEITRENYVKIDNTNLGADEVANFIKEKFNL